MISIRIRLLLAKATKRKCVMDTDNGKALQEKVADLEQLLWAYRRDLRSVFKLIFINCIIHMINRWKLVHKL